MFETNRPNFQEYDATPLDFPLRLKIQSILFIITSLIYSVFMFIPVDYEGVTDAGIVFKVNMLEAGLSSLSDLSERARYAPYILMFSSSLCVILVVLFILSAIKNYDKCRNGDKSLIVNNILLLISIPVTFVFSVDIISTYFESSMSYVDHRVGIWLAAIGIVALILVLIFGKISRVSILSTIAVILAIACFVAMFLFISNPFMVASYEGDNGEVVEINRHIEDFKRFYKDSGIRDHDLSIKRNGMVTVFNRGSFATRIMMFLPSHTLSVMMIAAYAMAISAFIITVFLIKKSCSYKKRSIGLIISKITLTISTVTFVWTFTEISKAIEDMKVWINKVISASVTVDSSFLTMTFAPTQYTLLAIAASALLLLLNVRGKRNPELT